MAKLVSRHDVRLYAFELLDEWINTLAISLISIIISFVALAGVAVSLFMQNRQLRISQIQATRATQATLMQIGLNNLPLAAEAFGFPDPDWLGKATLVNWQVQHWHSSHLIKAMSDEDLRLQAAGLFASEFAREWWVYARESERAATKTKVEKRFFQIMDTEFDRKQLEFEAAGGLADSGPSS
jgi:hypothetical protein